MSPFTTDNFIDSNFVDSQSRTVIETVIDFISTTTNHNISHNSGNGSSGHSNLTKFNDLNGTAAVTEVSMPLIKDVVCRDVYEPDSLENQFQFWISTVLLSIVALFGILGNTLSMVILSRPQMKSSISAVLFGLAACDTLLILTSIFLFSLPAVYPYTGYMFNYYYVWYPKLSPYIFPIAMTSQTASAYLTITVSCERFLVVYFPLQSRRWLDYERARIYVILILLFSFVYNIPRFLEVKVLDYLHPEYGIIYCIKSTALRSHIIYINFYVHWMYLIFICFIPFVTLSFFNVMIYRQIRKANKERLRLSRSEKREISLAVMLMCVVIVFLVCNILALILNMLEALYNMILENVNAVSNLLLIINSSVNFIIYVIFGEKFKRIFCQMLCKDRMARKDDVLRDDSTYSGDGSQRNSGRYQRGSFIRSYKAKKPQNSIHGSVPNSLKHYNTQTSLERGQATGDKITQTWALNCS